MIKSLVYLYHYTSFARLGLHKDILSMSLTRLKIRIRKMSGYPKVSVRIPANSTTQLLLELKKRIFFLLEEGSVDIRYKNIEKNIIWSGLLLIIIFW